MHLPGATQLPTIDTARLRLRWLVPGDVPALFAIFGDAAVCRYWSHPPLADVGAAHALHEQIVDRFTARSLFQWGVAERGTDAVIGTCTLASLSAQHERAEIGFAFAHDRWGQGHASEVLPALIGFAFHELSLHRLEADVDPRNAASLRALERAGFVREGLLAERYLVAGERQDAVLLGLLRTGWTKRNG